MPAEQTASAEETEALGAALARTLRPGDVVLVIGEMGAGKTTFVRGALRALGVEGPVTSPTFTIGRQYAAADGTEISHLDLHRLATLEGEDPSLLDDYVDDHHIAFVEWPEVAGEDLGPRVVARVTLEHRGGDARQVEISA